MQSSRLMADVSSNNAHVDVAAYSAAGHVAIAIKASEGTGYHNPGHKAQADAAHRHGLTVAHYHFARPGAGNVGRELANFRGAYLQAFRKGDLVVLDLEVNEGGGLDGYASTFLRELAALGHPTVLYTYRSFLAEHLRGVKVPGGRWWVADYEGPLSSMGHWAKQYTDGVNGPEPHRFSGVGQCDGSVLNRRSAAAMWLRKRRTGRR